MIPIGILTKDRVPYLDITLRSLSATQLPVDVPVTLYDDSSEKQETDRYYRTNDAVPIDMKWPTDSQWRMYGLQVIQQKNIFPVGISGKLNICKVATESIGVLNASCHAVSDLFAKHPKAQSVILLQDDVLFNPDWYTRLQQPLAAITKHTTKQVGVLAGIKLNQVLRGPFTKHNFVDSGITAQCLLITRHGYDTCRAFFRTTHRQRVRFDDLLRREMLKRGLWSGCVYPFVCQHFGINSLVRPGKRWKNADGGRIGYHVKLPFALGLEVRTFGGM